MEGRGKFSFNVETWLWVTQCGLDNCIQTVPCAWSSDVVRSRGVQCRHFHRKHDVCIEFDVNHRSSVIRSVAMVEASYSSFLAQHCFENESKMIWKEYFEVLISTKPVFRTLRTWASGKSFDFHFLKAFVCITRDAEFHYNHPQMYSFGYTKT